MAYYEGSSNKVPPHNGITMGQNKSVQNIRKAHTFDKNKLLILLSIIKLGKSDKTTLKTEFKKRVACFFVLELT